MEKLRPEISEKRKYWIDKHRFYELKHFCLQYPIWKKEYASLDGYSKAPVETEIVTKSNLSNPTEKCVEKREFFLNRIKLIEQTAFNTDPVIGKYILIGVTAGISYNGLKHMYNIPCCRNCYYELYRRFFWLLNSARK